MLPFQKDKSRSLLRDFDKVGERLFYSKGELIRIGAPPAAAALYSAALHRAAAAHRLVGSAVTIADAGPELSSVPKVIALSRDGVGLRPCGVVVALL